MHIVIDLTGGDQTVINCALEENPNDIVAKQEELRKKFLEEMFRRAPQPALQIIPVKR